MTVKQVTVFHKTQNPLNEDDRKSAARALRKGIKNLFSVTPVIVFLHGEVAAHDPCVRLVMHHDDGRVEEVCA